MVKLIRHVLRHDLIHLLAKTRRGASSPRPGRRRDCAIVVRQRAFWRLAATCRSRCCFGAVGGFEEADGVGALVLELVEGETLADRIARGSIPLNDAL
jgi:hypothetical protein